MTAGTAPYGTKFFGLCLNCKRTDQDPSKQTLCQCGGCIVVSADPGQLILLANDDMQLLLLRIKYASGSKLSMEVMR